MERLQKVIASYGYTSRRKAEELIRKGKVMVNGKIITELGTKVEANDVISIDSVIINKDVKQEYYLLNKPRQVISSVLDNIEGIGPKRKKELIKKYGSVKNIAGASTEELSTIIPEKTAKVLKEYLEAYLKDKEKFKKSEDND